jgi:hypothetical protein
MRKLLIALGLVLMVAVNAGGVDWWDIGHTATYQISDKPVFLDISKFNITKEQKVAAIKEWAKEGIVCEVYGHRWGGADDWRGINTISFNEKGEGTISRPSAIYRKCEICGQEQKYTPEKWEDWSEK